MASQFKDVSSDKGLAALNTYLATRSYIVGYGVSEEDREVYNKVSHPDGGKYPHVARWFNHIASFPAAHKFGAAERKEEKGGKPAAKSAPTPAAEEEEEEKELSFDDLEADSGETSADVAKVLNDKKKDVEEKPKKAGPVARSSIIIDVKPIGTETDMKKLEADVRAIKKEGLTWAAGDLVPIAYGIKKLRIICIVVDELISVDDLTEEIEKIEDCQSTDIHAFNKV